MSETPDEWNRSFSWSKISTYNRCGRQFKFKYIDDIEPEEDDYGSGREDGINFHEYMEHYYHGVDEEEGPTVEHAVELAKSMFEEHEQARYRPWLENWHAWQVKLYETWGPEHWTPTSVEEWVEVEWNGDVHHGYIDRIQWDPKREEYGVVDYKRTYSDASYRKGQIAYYGDILLQISDQLDEDVEWGGVYGYTDGKFGQWNIHWASTRASKKKVKQLKKIENGFEPDYGMHCDWCDFSEECTLKDEEEMGLLGL